MDGTMSAHPKVEKLIKIAGISTEHSDFARESFSTILVSEGEAALDRKIEHFENLNKRFAAWQLSRRKRAMPMARDFDVLDVINGEKIVLHRYGQLLDVLGDTLTQGSAVDLVKSKPTKAYVEYKLQRLSSFSESEAKLAFPLRIMDRMLEYCSRLVDRAKGAKREEMLITEISNVESIVRNVGGRIKHRVELHEPIASTQALECISHMIFFVSSYKPDCIISINPGGAGDWRTDHQIFKYRSSDNSICWKGGESTT